MLDIASIRADDIIQQKITIDDIQWKVCVLFGFLDVLSLAMNVLADAGWKPVNCWNDGRIFYAAMSKI